MDELIDQVVLPGDVIGTVTGEKKIRLGPGLMQDEDSIMATKAGLLRYKAERYWVENTQKRFVPAMDDLVVGIVSDKMNEGWKVDVGSSQLASLSIYAFEGGTKKNRPNLVPGSVVYARMSTTNKDVEPELSCTGASGKAEGFGPLTDGYLFKCSTGLSRQCLAADSIVLNEIGKYLPFEIAVGLNGRIWVKSTSVLNTTVISNAIINSEFLSAEKIVSMVKKLITKAQKEQRD